MRSVVNEKFFCSAVSFAQSAFSKSLLTGIFLLTLLASTQASAQHVQMNEYFCADDVSDVGSCTANEVSLAVVEQVQITDENDVPITQCVAGQTIKIANLKAALNSNTGERYDVTFWIGRLGNDPRNPYNDDPAACAVTSLPDDTGSAFVGNYEGNQGDNCLDFKQPPSPLELNFGGGGATFLCNDSNNDGQADIQVLTTWNQNTNFSCGFGDQTSPFNIGDPVFKPGAPSKCDFTHIEVAPIVQVASLTIDKETLAGQTGAFDFTGTGFPAATTFDGVFQLDTTGSNPASLTDAAIILSDPINGDTYTINETVPAGWNLVAAFCSNGDDPRTGVTLLPGANVTCTFTNAPDGSVNIVKQSLGGDDTFSFTSTTGTAPTFDLMTVGGSVSRGGTALTPGEYEFTELALAGWDLTDLSCVDPSGNSTVDLSTSTATVNLSAGESVTCTFVNTKRGQITLNKTTLPSSASAFEFSHNIPGGQASPVNVNAGTPQVFADVVPGTYTITEADPTPGYDLDSIVCVDGTNNVVDSTVDLSTGTATVNLDPGESVNCTFTNTQRSNLTVVKQLSATGPALMDFDFISADLGNFSLSPTAAGMAGSASTTFSNLVETYYDLAETDSTAGGWALVSATCSNGTDLLDPNEQRPGEVFVNAGDDVTCTFINSPLGSSTIIKNSIGGNDTFGFTGTAANGVANPMDGLSMTTTGGTDQADFTNQLHPNGNPFTVTESNAPGWMLTDLACTEDGTTDSTVDLDTATATINVDFAETVTCTFTNTADAQLIVTKSTVPAGLAEQFTFTSDGSTNWDSSGSLTTALADGDSDSQTGQPGFYMATETVLPGFQVTNITCTGETTSSIQIGGGDAAFEDGDNFVEVTLTPGEVVTCDFENTALGSITVVKDTIGADGSFEFNSVLNNGVFTLDTVSNTAERTFNDLLPGSYMIGEVVPNGWDLSGISCVGETNSSFTYTSVSTTVRLTDGEDIVCTFTNTRLASLELVKTVTNDHGGTAIATDWELSATGGTNISGDGGVAATFVALGDYTLAESAGPAGYTAGAWSCNGGTLNGATLTLAAGDVAVCTIVNDDDAASLALVKNVTNDNGGTALAENWTLSADGPTQLSGAGGVAATPVNAGVYTLTEAGGPSGYTASAWSCTAGTLNGNSLTLALGDTAICSITNDDEAATLSMTKIVTNDNGGTAVDTDWLLSADGPTPSSGQGGFTAASVDAGVYTLTESAGPEGYTAGVWVCSGGSLSGNVLTLANGETASCSITNDDVAPGLTLVKTVTNDHGGSAAITDWTLRAVGPDETIVGVSGSPAVTGASISAGSYTLSEENGPGGYTAGAWVCTGAASQSGNVVTIESGQSVVCTINNDDDPAQLTLVKTVTNDNEGEAVATDWTLSATGSSSSISGVTGAPAVTAASVFAGTYTLAETGEQPGYTAGAWECGQATVNGDQLTLASGENVTCTINNDDDPAAINLTKTVNGPATMELDGTYTVVYTITASNAGGPGKYDLLDEFSPGAGITLNTAEAEYVAGTEDDQSGTPGVYPNFVTDESLAPGLNESWTVTANFTADPAAIDPVSSQCDPANPVANTGFYNAISGSDSDTIGDDNYACIGLPQAGLTLIKVIEEGDNSTVTAEPADFNLTLTGTDGVHDSGMDYQTGATPEVLLGVEYMVAEAPDQIPGYAQQSIQCVDDATLAEVSQPFTLTGSQNVTCTVTNLVNEVVFNELAEACRANAAYVDYDVTTSVGVASDVTVTWIKDDGSDEVVQTLQNQPTTGSLLWPGTQFVGGLAVAWPGWSCDAQGANCTPINDGLVPTMKLKFEINPEETVVVEYPTSTPNCLAGPRPPVPEVDAIPVPIDNKFALLMLVLMLLGSGWFLRLKAGRER